MIAQEKKVLVQKGVWEKKEKGIYERYDFEITREVDTFASRFRYMGTYSEEKVVLDTQKPMLHYMKHTVHGDGQPDENISRDIDGILPYVPEGNARTVVNAVLLQVKAILLLTENS
ncbi:MAG: hypothetical protein JRN26_01810 [Nitrososphaerota archaeon]|jgi:hypothetical protein|nr:hypothetical protein [Nitrososphaerota archaeon]MDG6935613.1 hypothetical protein [Nitrososphaerota archaeon]MDG6944890.1 hypothetical protein [Nitrososphaerota archaeon]